MSLPRIFINLASNRGILDSICRVCVNVRTPREVNTNVLIKPKDIQFWNSNESHVSVIRPSMKEIETPIKWVPLNLPQYKKQESYKNPLEVNEIIAPIRRLGLEYVEQGTQEEYMCNKLRNDKKHRKRAFTKRGYFRRTRCLTRKANRLSYAYALQGIDYEMLENLEMGEIPDLKDYIK